MNKDLPCYEIAPIAGNQHLVQNYGRFPLRFVEGLGAWLTDDQGRKFLDAFAGIAVNVLGYRHPGIVQAICRQADTLLHSSNYFHNAQQERLAELLVQSSFAGQVFFCNSGTEANEAVFKLFRRYSHKVYGGTKPRILAAVGSFHGRTMGALSLTHTAAYRDGFEPLFPVDFVPYGDKAALEKAMRPDVAGIILEPIQCESGVTVPPPGYFAAVRELCDLHGALLAVDEVQTGIGRTAKTFCFEHEGIVPDLMSLAKGLGGGVPIGAVVMKPSLAALLIPGTHGTTFGGNHLACAVGAVVMETIQRPGFLTGVAMKGQKLRGILETVLGNLASGPVRGRGLILGIPLIESRPVKGLIEACQRRGLIVGLAGGNVLRLAPPLTITDEDITQLQVRLQAAVSDWVS